MILPTTMPIPPATMGDTPQAEQALSRVRAMFTASAARRTYDHTTRTQTNSYTLLTAGR